VSKSFVIFNFFFEYVAFILNDPNNRNFSFVCAV